MGATGLRSSGVPWPPLARNAVENRQQLAQRGEGRELLRAPAGVQSLIEGGDRWVVANVDERGHVQDPAHRRAPPAYKTPPPHRAAVPIEWCDANKCRDPAPIELPQFRQIGDERARSDGPNPRRRAQKIIGLPPQRTGAHEPAEILVHLP